jgi:hypothetical protein
MELVIRVDLEKAPQPLAEIFKLIGDCRFTEEVKDEETSGAVTLVRNGKPVVVGRWEVEEAEDAADPQEVAYRAAAAARYAQPPRIEVDRFAKVSAADDGAYVQGWLHVPRADVVNGHEGVLGKKPPQSVVTMRKADAKAS